MSMSKNNSMLFGRIGPHNMPNILSRFVTISVLDKIGVKIYIDIIYFILLNEFQNFKVLSSKFKLCYFTGCHFFLFYFFLRCSKNKFLMHVVNIKGFHIPEDDLV